MKRDHASGFGQIKIIIRDPSKILISVQIHGNTALLHGKLFILIAKELTVSVIRFIHFPFLPLMEW